MIAVANTNSIEGLYHVDDKCFCDAKEVYDKRRKTFRATLNGMTRNWDKRCFDFYDDGEDGHDGHEVIEMGRRW